MISVITNGYSEIKQIAKACGCRITDLLALAPANDPFYAGSPAGRRDAEWFARIWEQFNFGSGTHLRRIHYRIVSQDPPIPKPDGKPYLNTDNDWKYLGSASLAARYLGLVPAENFIDRRNPKPQAFWKFQECNPSIRVYDHFPDIWMPQCPDMPALTLTGFEMQQNFLTEVWCEKSTMNDILVPLCQSLGTNLVTGVGEMSETMCRDLVHRVQNAGVPARIFYISDFDPAGRSMPKAVCEKLNFTLCMMTWISNWNQSY